MEWVWRLLFLMAAAQSVQAEIQLVQSGSELMQTGQSVKISCKASGYTFTQYGMNRVKQVPGQGLKRMGGISTNTGNPAYADGFKERCVFSMDTSVSTAYLQINSLNNEDMATYYCARHSVKNHILRVSKTLREDSSSVIRQQQENILPMIYV